MTIYLFSGLGADERVFQKLIFPADYKIVHIKWEKPDSKDTLEQYCERLIPQINQTEKFAFIGLSFGGIVAIEVAKQVYPEHLIVISSISNNNELSTGYKMIRLFRLHLLIPSKLYTKPFFLTYWAFGIKSKEDKELLYSVIIDTPPYFFKWAINQLLSWKNEKRPLKIFHIHGSADRIFGVKKVNTDVCIQHGGHFMIYNKAEEISKRIIESLSE